MVLSAAMLAACGDSSDDATKANASTPAKATTTAKATQAAASTTAPAAPIPAEAPATGPDGKKLSPEVRGWIKEGTARLAAVRIGTPGKLVVEPKGNVNYWDHYYPPGTVVTVTAKDTKTARFAEWSGACVGKDHVCKVKMTGYKRLIGGFNLDAKAASGLPKDDPALKFDTGSPGS
jgi:pyruvate/2-oxoglutarate dehydrogenase complex dihydrolipoamide acyltransferase (E2) component